MELRRPSWILLLSSSLASFGTLSCQPAADVPSLAQASPSPDLSNPDRPVPVDQDPPFTTTFADFPPGPLLDAALPADLPAQFSSATAAAAGGPCLTEPPIDALFPKNWTPPLFAWTPPADMNVFEFRVHIANQDNDLLLYTANRSYSLPPDLWSAIAAHSAGFNVTLSVRGARLDGASLSLASAPAQGSQGNVHIAPAVAPGTVVYWTTSNGSALKGFHIGEPSVTTLVTPPAMSDGTQCVGCHAVAPDGKLVFLSRNGNVNDPFNLDARLLDGSAAEASPLDVSPDSLSLLRRTDQTLPSFSPAHYSAADAVVLSELSDSSGQFQIAWTDLHAQGGAAGFLRRDGDPGQAATPAFTSDGLTVAYTSTNQVTDGRPRTEPADIYTIPYNDRSGGPATPLPGASEAAFSEYYPSYSPGDQLLVFDRVAAGTNMYAAPSAEIFVLPARGGAATRIAANDPPACSGLVSPGLTNSWPKWAPGATQVGDKHYYWLVFSSKRGSAVPQLYISAVVTQDQGGAEVLWKTYPAVYLTTQVPEEGNHTPAWGNTLSP